jgi:heat shock protein HslJ
MTYSLTTKYLGKQEEPYSISGNFEWKGNNIKLGGIAGNDRANLYKAEENRLRQLDIDGNIITGELESNYILRKNGNPQVENKKWTLIEIRGKSVNENPETHYLIFHTENNLLEAKAGCNVLLNTYKIQNDVRLTVIPGISTLMACPDGSLEPDLIEVLKMVDNISVNNDELSLNKAKMAPLARFRLNKRED